MNRNPHIGAPPCPPCGSQDVRGGSSFPTQAPAPIGGISLKKPAVRVVRPARLSPGTPSRASAPSPAPPVKAEPKDGDGHALPAPAASTPSAPTLENTISSVSKEADALEELFARLNRPSTPKIATSTLKGSSKSFAPAAEAKKFASSTTRGVNKEADSATAIMPFISGVKAEASFKGGLVTIKKEPDDKDALLAPATSNIDKIILEEKREARASENATAVSKQLSPQSFERQFLQKAAECITSLPSDVGPTAEIIKSVTDKIRRPYAPSAVLEPEVVEVLKARYVDAVVTFLGEINRDKKRTTKEQIGEILATSDGNFLYLCAVLADEEYISIENLDQIVGLSRAIGGVLPEADDAKSASPVLVGASKHPLDGMASWPAREKRVNAPGCRTCLLTGLPENLSINKLQALVWGGRIESLQLPNPGSKTAVVKFFTPEACEKYFNATENGITIPGTKIVVSVEKAEGPNSVNDVLAACTEGDATRCIRAYDVDEDWGDVLLMKLASRAKGGQPKREVDTIKRGSTARGRSYIEFRFANVYGALQFKRELMDDPDWEHCTIGYAPDPCETAQGVHIKDEDEKAKSVGFF
ncbi:uncharacterized protein CC84DRAFT_1264234 [Paraphaeosphaeria sporulosa]|uniref:RRM domain-containing protein n=1 Tax=Paraphaeosphaeria sporulosa TaxID=1460663 RepID=A0A177BV04_9PLEO|nr:uncharacterized protein CC84DRAFT_1264234 [Paraphaeosphaeria sporulosa]OAF99222.1 hypothetical protein CC84DRAFT_1264234 [Paraphaeosphaeria sporulosa]